MKRLLVLASVFMSIGAAGCFRKRVELKLTVPKAKWEEGESLWYRLEVKNVGWRTVTIDDPFWFAQHSIVANERAGHGTYLIVQSPRGDRVRPSGNPFGFHGEFDLWTNDCGNGKPCGHSDVRPISLRRGQSFIATPSIEAPIRGNGQGYRDIRALPSKADGTDIAGKKDWQRKAESVFLLGDPRRSIDTEKAKRERVAGCRILDTVWLLDRGRYTVKAVMNLQHLLPPLSAAEEMQRPGWCASSRAEVCDILAGKLRDEWVRKTSKELDELRAARARLEEENRDLLNAESNQVEFEVVKGEAPGPALEPHPSTGSAVPSLDRKALGRTLLQSR